MRRLVSVFVAALVGFAAVLSVSAPAGAQVVGSITGNVYDQNGSPLRGVKITADSPTQIGGVKTVYSGEDGQYRIVGLQPGVFRVGATAPKLRRVEQLGVNVGVNAPAQVDFMMEVETAQEEVRVLEKAPLISTTSSAVKETFDEDFLDLLPLESRDSYLDIMNQNVSGSYDAGGNKLHVRGGDGNQNTFTMDGFRINGHGVQGNPGQLATLRTVAAMEVQTAGYGAENATSPGSVLNMVTKTGSNKYELDVNGYHTNHKMRLFLDSTDRALPSWNSKLRANFSGPLIRDRLWFFTTAEFGTDVSDRGKDLTGFRPDPAPGSNLDLRGLIKLTWQVSTRHKLQTMHQGNWVDRKNNEGGTQTDREGQLMVRDYNSFHSLS